VDPTPPARDADGPRDGPADLHLHATCSDGLLSVRELAEAVAEAGIAVAALTDHDTLEGVAEFAALCRDRRVVPVTGVEISALHPLAGERHLLGYGVDLACPELGAALADNLEARRTRLDSILVALGELGLPLSVEAVLAEAGGGSVGRPHVADALVRAGHAASRQEAFERWLGDGKPAAVPKGVLTCARAIELIHGAGGLAVLAHPGRQGDPLALPGLLRDGLDGLEVYHPSHSDADRLALQAVARRHDLLETGGSDNHGDAKGMQAMRSCPAPGRVARALFARLDASRRRRMTGSFSC
jgi:predicted metal-dependent phosphoesterase TrpH